MKLIRNISLLFCIVIISFLLLFKTPALAQLAQRGVIVGYGIALDGDTIKIGNINVRLVGLDAPELNQKCKTKSGREFLCGKIAKLKLDSYLSEGKTYCQKRGLGALGRLLAECWVVDSDQSYNNLNEKMIFSGMAFAHTKFSEEYTVLEGIAKKRQIGIWALEFEYPWEFREQQNSSKFKSSKSFLIPKNNSSRCPSSAPYCKNIGSCSRACFLLKCGFKRLDRDRDGIPCENVCRRRCP